MHSQDVLQRLGASVVLELAEEEPLMAAFADSLVGADVCPAAHALAARADDLRRVAASEPPTSATLFDGDWVPCLSDVSTTDVASMWLVADYLECDAVLLRMLERCLAQRLLLSDRDASILKASCTVGGGGSAAKCFSLETHDALLHNVERYCDTVVQDARRSSLCNSAAKLGSLKLLQWARANGCLWDTTTCTAAARGGHLEVLQWARANGCPWDSWTCAEAARGGHLEVLQWARANGCNWHQQTTCVLAASGGHLGVLQWAHANGCGDWAAVTPHTCTEAARGGHLEVLQWARANGCLWDSWTCAEAARGGYLEVLQWARANGCPWDSWTCAYAARGGHLGVLQWARANGCPWDGGTCTAAAGGGHLAVLQWARANGCPWNYSYTCAAAEHGGNLEVLQWVRANGT